MCCRGEARTPGECVETSGLRGAGENRCGKVSSPRLRLEARGQRKQVPGYSLWTLCIHAQTPYLEMVLVYACMYMHVHACIRVYISLDDVENCANSVGFRGSLPLLPHLCPLSVPEVGYVGYVRKALEKGYSEHPGSACCTDDMFEIFVLFGHCLCCFLPVFVNRQPCPHMNSHHVLPCSVASPDATQKPLVRKRARSGGANWVQVTHQMSPSTAKRPRTTGLQQPACTHEEHQILSTVEAASFASQF